MTETLYLIDTHALIYRAFYAMENLRAPDGTPVNAIFQFVRMLVNLRRDHRPEYLIAVFDSPGKNFRHQIFPDYKATRKITPPELTSQINPIRDLIRLYAIDTCSADGYEADDVIGTLARQAEAQGMKVVIISGDKDLAQLLTDRVSLFDPQKEIFFTAEDYEQKNGFAPARLPDLFGLWGDTADNIPGVAGIGEKIGRELIVKYGTLEAVLDHAGEIKGKRGEALKSSREIALLSKDLATIRTDAPVVFVRQQAQVKEPNWAELRLIFTRYGFRSLVAEMQFDSPQIEMEVINTPEKFKRFITAWRAADIGAIALASADEYHEKLLGLAVCFQDNFAYYLPFPALVPEQIAALQELLAAENFPKYVYDYKDIFTALTAHNFILRGVVFDALLAGHLAAAHINDHSLSALALRYLGISVMEAEEIIGSGARQISFGEAAEAAPEKVAAYFANMAAVGWRLFAALADKLDAAEKKYLQEIELPLSEVLAVMQRNGVKINWELLDALRDETAEIIAALRKEIFTAAGEEFNLDSPRQISEILFERLQMPAARKTKTGYSTDEATLKELATQGYALPLLVLDYRHYAKLKSGYLDALPNLRSPRDGRVRTTFSQIATTTGRLASHRPNLQNIPVRSEKGRAIRAAFITEPDWQLLAADYSQIELRVLAHFSGDENLLAAFAANRDIHTAVAARVNQVEETAVTPEQRQAAKAVNFGIIYGQSAHGLAEALGIPHYAAQNFIDRYFNDFPQVKNFIEQTIAQAADFGFVKTLFGRRREIPELKSSKKNDRERGAREAVNTLIQGTAAEIIKIAMVNLARRFTRENFFARLLLQIHDELVLETPRGELEKLRVSVREEMENAVPLKVPLKVEIGIGGNWLEAK